MCPTTQQHTYRPWSALSVLIYDRQSVYLLAASDCHVSWRKTYRYLMTIITTGLMYSLVEYIPQAIGLTRVSSHPVTSA